MGSHIVNGEFQSDKYPTCPPGKVPLSVNDTTAQDLLWEYAQRRRVADAEFASDLETALRDAGYRRKEHPVAEWLRSADAGAMFGSSTWGLRQSLARALDEGLHLNWRSRVESF